MSRLLLASLCALAALAQQARAQAFTVNNAGTAAMDFLNLGVDAKAAGMGGAYTAVAEGASACYWNPAGLVQTNKYSATFMRANYAADISYQYMAYAQRLNYYSVLGASLLMTNIGDIPYADMDGTLTGSTFSPRDMAYNLTYSRAILELSDKDHDVSMGVTMRYVNSRIMESASAYMMDFGLMAYYFSELPYRLGFVLQNLGRGPQFDQQVDPLPLNVKLGGSISPFPDFLVASDLVLQKAGPYYFTLGAQYSTIAQENMRLSLRAGINSQQMKITGGASGISLGAGIGLQFFNLDYAFVPMGELGYTHRISLSFDFPYWLPVFQRKDKTVFSEFQEIAPSAAAQ
ncbi:MAG: PorV/PorQ family protein [Elusimicrobiales bacterium]